MSEVQRYNATAKPPTRWLGERTQRIKRHMCGTAVVGLALGLLVLACGCAGTSRELQTFIAEDPDSGERALYQVSIKGAGIGGVKYYVSGAYLPRTSIELYEGKIPRSLADLDAAAPGGASATGEILAEYHALLKTQAKLEREAHEGQRLESAKERRAVRRFFADTVADSMLSVSELRSISESGSDDPYRFRKLVYFVSTEPIKIQDFQGELGEIESTLDTLAKTMGDARQKRKQAAEARHTQQKQKLQAIASFLSEQPDLADSQNAWKLLGLITGGAE